MIRWTVLGLLLLAACGDDSAEACVTRADCRDDQVCINGGCSLVAADASAPDAPAPDAESPDGEVADAESDADNADSGGDFCPTVDCGPGILCDEERDMCVRCVSNAGCTAPEAAVCNVGTGACEPCTSSTDCAGNAGGAICESGLCVECTEAESSACGDFSCDPSTNLCTTTPVSSLSQCEACVSDSECIGGGCIAMTFMGEAHGSYCLQQASIGCERGFRTFIDRVSVSGAPVQPYCGIQEDLTTCEAVLSIGRICEVRDDCELGASCEGFIGVPVCTIPCDGGRDCPEGAGAGSTCDGGFCRLR